MQLIGGQEEQSAYRNCCCNSS